MNLASNTDNEPVESELLHLNGLQRRAFVNLQSTPALPENRITCMGVGMKYFDERLSDEEFDSLFYEALYAFDGSCLFFRKARHGGSFIRADS